MVFFLAFIPYLFPFLSSPSSASLRLCGCLCYAAYSPSL